MSFDFGYLVSVNPAAGYANQYYASLINQMQSKIDSLEDEASMDDFEKGYHALLEGDTNKAIRLWEKEAQAGVTEAHVALGDLYHHRLKNLSKALTHYEKAYKLGETKAGALIYAAKLNLGKLEKKDLDSAQDDIKSEPWFKYVYAVLKLREIDFLGAEEGSTTEIIEALDDAIDGGVLPASTLLCKLMTIETVLVLYSEAKTVITEDQIKYIIEQLDECISMGEASALEIYLLWLLWNFHLDGARNAIDNFLSQFEWPEDKSFNSIALCKAFLSLPSREKSVSKKLFGVTKSITSVLGSGALDQITTDWERFEDFKRQVNFLDNDRKYADLIFNTLNEFGPIEARRVLAMEFIKLAFDESEDIFGGKTDEDFMLHVYMFLQLSRICITDWDNSAKDNKADPEYLDFLPIFISFTNAFFGSEEDFEENWYNKNVSFDSSFTREYNEFWLPLLSRNFETLNKIRKKLRKGNR